MHILNTITFDLITKSDLLIEICCVLIFFKFKVLLLALML